MTAKKKSERFPPPYKYKYKPGLSKLQFYVPLLRVDIAKFRDSSGLEHDTTDAIL